MDNDYLLSVFIIIAIISVIIIDIIIIYIFVNAICCKTQQVRNETIMGLHNPLITTSINDDNYYTRL